jgi:hypothetical protein
MSLELRMWVVYYRPLDYPDQWVARERIVRDGKELATEECDRRAKSRGAPQQDDRDASHLCAQKTERRSQNRRVLDMKKKFPDKVLAVSSQAPDVPQAVYAPQSGRVAFDQVIDSSASCLFQAGRYCLHP